MEVSPENGSRDPAEVEHEADLAYSLVEMRLSGSTGKG
jgi:hypothetical protein